MFAYLIINMKHKNLVWQTTFTVDEQQRQMFLTAGLLLLLLSIVSAGRYIMKTFSLYCLPPFSFQKNAKTCACDVKKKKKKDKRACLHPATV